MTWQNEFAQALLRPDPACPSGLRAWNGSDPQTRFSVYRNNVVVSLIDALADSFPVVQALVGEAFFHAVAKMFVQSNRPTSPLMARYGHSFPEFLSGFGPAQSLPYLPDVARLELQRVQAYHAADVAPMRAELLRASMADAQQLETLRVTLHPSVHVIRSQFAVFSLWAAHQGALCISSVDPLTPQGALTYRNGLSVETLALPPGATLFIQALQTGTPLMVAADAPARAGVDFDLPSTLAHLIRYQLLISIHHDNEATTTDHGDLSHEAPH